jgi:chromosome segregation ATPase
MIKKLIVAGVALVVLPAVLWTTDPGGYISAGVRYFNFEPSLEFQIERAKSLLGKLDDQIKSQQELAAEQQARVDILKQNLDRATSELKGEREKLVAYRAQLRKAEQTVSIDDRSAKTLDRQLKNVQFKERVQGSTAKQHENALKRFTAMEDGITHLKNYREEAKQTLSTLEAELEAAKSEQIHARYAIDDSQFSQLKELLDKIDLGVKTQQNLVNMQKDADDLPVQPAVSAEDVLSRVDAYLEQKDAPRVANGN